ncbi:uncharacterized protein LAJ45_05225 [Morchella importuna]|uniref:uncharacterized protein n=1 Tax=Morchella importuna TaxID=1174673 RepID=UPI001E8CD04A|nr:uncharacterized protein LAJ45_05225 [Morchella importuna]KAH8150529.1 hypothetical protein LAJ45_05225 [Morchella importuna]
MILTSFQWDEPQDTRAILFCGFPRLFKDQSLNSMKPQQHPSQREFDATGSGILSRTCRITGYVQSWSSPCHSTPPPPFRFVPASPMPPMVSRFIAGD